MRLDSMTVRREARHRLGRDSFSVASSLRLPPMRAIRRAMDGAPERLAAGWGERATTTAQTTCGGPSLRSGLRRETNDASGWWAAMTAETSAASGWVGCDYGFDLVEGPGQVGLFDDE